MNKYKIIISPLLFGPLWLVTSLRSNAVIVAGSNGANNTNSNIEQLEKIAPDFVYANNFVTIGGGTGIYLGPGNSGQTGYVLTADHLAKLSIGSDLRIDGNGYEILSRTQINTNDLYLYEVDSNSIGKLPDLPTVSIASAHPSVNDEILMLGRGTRIQGTDGNPLTSDTVNQNGFDVYNWGGASTEISFGLNNVSGDIPWAGGNATVDWSNGIGHSGSLFYSIFDDPGSGNYNNSWEGQASSGDSGGSAFIKRDGVWELAGITSVTLSNGRQPANTAAFGNATAFANVAAYESDFAKYIGLSTVPEPSTAFLVAAGSAIAITRRKRKTKYEQ